MSSATMNSSEASVTLQVNYTDSEGIGGNQDITINSSLSIEGVPGPSGSAGENGVTGPGVVHTGVWEEGRDYQFDDGLLTGTGRRDTVLLNEIYYAATRSHTSTNDNSELTGRPDSGGPWVSLGTEDFFVAAKIAIFEESFIQNTLNIGTNNSGGSSVANITLYGGSTQPYFSLGQNPVGQYDETGIFIGRDTDNEYKLSLKSATNSLLWDGTNLTVNGGGTFTGALSGGTISIGSGNSIFKADSNGIYLGNSTFGSAPFRVNPDGALTATNATITGDITANTGELGDLDVTGTLNVDGGTIKVDHPTEGRAVTFNDNGLSISGIGITVSPIPESFKLRFAGDPQLFALTDVNANLDNGFDIIQDFVIENRSSVSFPDTSSNTIIIDSPTISLRGNVFATGNITAFASSDKRLKDNIIPITKSLDKINKLSGYEFDWNDKQTSFKGHDIGLLAQEVQEVYPELVGEQNTGYLGVRYEKLVPLLVQGIKELTQRVEELERGK